MNNNWQFTKRRLQNNWRTWRDEHITRSKVFILVITISIFILAVPLLIFIALSNDAQQTLISDITKLERSNVVVVYGIDPALDSVGLRQQIFSQIPQLGSALDRSQIQSLVLASPQQVENPAPIDLKQGSLAVLPNIKDTWDFCVELRKLSSPHIVIVADTVDVPKIAFVCKNFGLEVKILQFELYPPVAKSGLWLRSLLELVGLVWRVNSSTISLYE